MTKDKNIPNLDEGKTTGPVKPKTNHPATWNHSSSQTEASALQTMLKTKSSTNHTDSNQT